MGTEVVPAEGFVGASPPAANSISLSTDSIPACRSAPSTVQPPLPTTEVEDSAWSCDTCGGDAEPLHRLKQDEAVCYFCSACILLLYKGMYCCLCFVVYENSSEQIDPALWLTCAKCQRMSHLVCAHDHNLPTDSVFFTCGDCSKLEKAPSNDTCTSTGHMVENGSPPHKKLRRASDRKISLKEALAAAHIVAFVAVKQAKDAKARARALAGVAAKAAARAKAALDTAHRVGLEEARWKSESMKRFPGVLSDKNKGLPSFPVLNAPRISRADGRVSMPNLQRLHSYSLSQKDLLRKDSASLGYTTQCSAPNTQTKTCPVSGEPVKSSSSSQNAFPKNVVFQKPQAVCVQGRVERVTGIESEGAVASASPAIIRDASCSLDTLRLNTSSAGSGSAQGILRSAVMTNTLSAVLTGSDPSKSMAQMPVSKEQLSVIGNGVEDTSISAP